MDIIFLMCFPRFFVFFFDCPIGPMIFHVLVVQFGGFLKWGTPILGNLHLVDVDHGPHPWLPLHGTPAPMEAAIDVVNARVVHALRASLTFVDWFYKVGPIVIGK